jgi:integrase
VFRFEGKRHFISTGLSDTPYNRKLVQDRALEIERDIQYGEFDATLEKYKPKSVLSTVEAPPKIQPSTSALLELWKKYMEYKSPHASPKTINGTYQPVTAHLSKGPTDGLKDPLKFWAELLKATTESQARRTLM